MSKTLSEKVRELNASGLLEQESPQEAGASGHLLRIQRYCINDGPGIRTTVFLQGCALRCKWCHNPESFEQKAILMFNERLCQSCGLCVKACPNDVHSFVDGVHKVDFEKCEACGECLKTCMPEALSLHGRKGTVEEILEEILQDRDYYEASGGGVTISGGEPLRQPEFVIELAKACQKEGLSVYLDTCGFASEATFLEVAEVVAGFLFDVKVIDSEKHAHWTGQDNALILENFGRAVASGKTVRMRVIVIEGLTDTKENLEGLVALSRKTGFSGPVDLMPYHRMGAGKYRNMGKSYEMEGVEPPTAECIGRVKQFFEEAGFTTTIQ